MTEILSMEQVALANKRVIMRVDMNVPIHAGAVSDDQRIHACLPDIKTALDANAALLLISHLGRPNAGKPDAAFSLQPVASHLSKLLGKTVPLVGDYLNGVDVQPGEVILCENIRFQSGELENDDTLATRLADLCDIYIMNAFGCAHRAHASTHKAIAHAKIACAGSLLAREVSEIRNALGYHTDDHTRCLHRVAVVGGSKVSGKLELLSALSEQVDTLIIGGGIANTFIAGTGCNIGRSLYDKALVSFGMELQDNMKAQHKQLLLPSDVVCAKELSEHSDAVYKSVDDVQADEMILDIGLATQAAYADAIADADYVLWNGPLGAFEYAPFSNGTGALVQAIKHSPAHIVAGGGDTLAAIKEFELQRDNMYISTGGGAFLQLVSGQELPALTMLHHKAANHKNTSVEH